MRSGSYRSTRLGTGQASRFASKMQPSVHPDATALLSMSRQPSTGRSGAERDLTRVQRVAGGTDGWELWGAAFTCTHSHTSSPERHGPTARTGLELWTPGQDATYPGAPDHIRLSQTRNGSQETLLRETRSTWLCLHVQESTILTNRRTRREAGGSGSEEVNALRASLPPSTSGSVT